MTRSYDGIIILGCPRSGTTLLRRLFNAHPDICCPPETNVLSACSRFLEEYAFAGGMSVGVLPGLRFSDLPDDYMLDKLRELAFGTFNDIRDASGKKVWAEKTAFDAFHIDAIERLCGERCRYVVINRHGLDVAVSINDLVQKMEMFLPELHAYVQRHPSALEAYAHAWVDVTQRLERLVEDHPDACVRLRYEDLVEAPAEQLARIFDALDLSTDAGAVVDKALAKSEGVGLGDWKTYERRAITRGSVERWRRLSDWTLNRLAAIVNPTMEAVGYEPVARDASLDDDDEEAQHRYQIGLMVAQMKASKAPEADPDADSKSGDGE